MRTQFPKKGLHYQDGLNRLLKYSSAISNPNMRDALIDDIRMAEGSEAATEAAKEFSSKRYGSDRITHKRAQLRSTAPFLQGTLDPHGLKKYKQRQSEASQQGSGSST